MSLLTLSSPKLLKGEAFGWLSAVLYLMPADFSGVANVCPMASAGCKASCLVTAGRASMAREFDARGLPVNSIMRARQRRTEEYVADREGFARRILPEARSLVRRAHKAGKRAALRLNGTSDIAWWRNRVVASELRAMVEDGALVLYDYTKVATNLKRAPGWYHLTLSRSERNAEDVAAALAAGFNVAVVFGGPLPQTWQGYPVVNGDKHDLTFLHPAPCILGLKAKGRAKKDETGFVVRNY